MPTALERVEALKRDRRAEIKAAEEDRKRQEDEQVAARAAAIKRGRDRALEESQSFWLCEFYAGAEPGGTWNKLPLTEVHFDVPGHRRIALRLLEASDGFHPVHHQTSGELASWMGKGFNGWVSGETLADALIAAEVKPGEDPIPF